MARSTSRWRRTALAWVDESGGVTVHSSTQHPSGTQEIVARVLGLPRSRVVVECLRMGGAFGGKEVQASPYAAVAAVGAWKTGRPVRYGSSPAGHGAHGQTPSVPRALLGRLRERRPIPCAAPRAVFGWRMEPRSVRAGDVAIVVSL